MNFHKIKLIVKLYMNLTMKSININGKHLEKHSLNAFI